jgi:hypothetical protein
MPREIYYSGDVSKRPVAGDKFIQVDWDEDSLTLDLRRGVYPEGLSIVPKPVRFSTLDELHEAVHSATEGALGRGFKPYTLLYVQAEGSSLP